MYINSIDNLFDGTIDKFYLFIKKDNKFNNFSKDTNFVKYQNEILKLIKNFVDSINQKEIEQIFKSKNYTSMIINIIKRYCAFYIFLGISYNYKGDRDLFITNLIEASKMQKDTTVQIENFFNSENNSKIIEYYQIIKDIIELKKYKTIERVKIILSNNPIKYQITIKLFNELGEDFIEKYFLIDDNFHNIIKTFIFKNIYKNEEKNNILNILNEKEIDDAEYKYIEIVVSGRRKLIDFTFFQKILNIDELKKGIAEDYYDFLEKNKDDMEIEIYEKNNIIDFLFSNNFLIPISEDFLRYHKSTEKYDKKIDSLKERDSTKIKYVINKVNKIKNLHSSILKKNPKLKLSTLDLFFKPLDNRDAILYNDNEEVKIIKKLELSELSTDADYLVDLENIKSYNYLNFKDFSKDGFILRTSKSVQAIRFTNIKNKQNKNNNIELRIGNDNIPLNVVGIVFNPSGKSLDCFKIEALKNIKSSNNINDNGFKIFKKLIENTTSESKNDNKLHYWLFDSNTDVIKLDEYKNVSSIDKNKYIEIMINELFYTFESFIKFNLVNTIKNEKTINFEKINQHLKKFKKDNLRLENINLKLEKHLTLNLIDTLLKEVDEIPKSKDKSEVIKLPTSDKIKKSKKFILLKTEEEIKKEKVEIKDSICHHYLKWNAIKKIPKKESDKQNQAVFNFVKQYVKINDHGDYICKSCDEMLNLKKYVYEGTYIEELDTFLTTNLAVNQKLTDIPKYSKYTRTIRNLEKNIEKICYTIGLNYYLGNIPVIQLRRRMIVKDIIDLIIIHTKYLKTQPKNRTELSNKNYNIHKDLTNLFFFELKDEIFLTSSDEKDYYKLIKFNNVISYIVILIITELNAGQLMNLKDDKMCNFFLYEKVGKNLFDNLLLRLNEKNKISISNLPLLGYTLFYFSCMLTNNYIWQWDKEKNISSFTIQKIIIHTLVDLINSLIEANLQEDKNFLYEIIANRFLHKLKTLYNDKNIIDILRNNISKKIKVSDNKISFIVKKEKIIKLDGKEDVNMLIENKGDFCEALTYNLNKKEKLKLNNSLSDLTNCPDGKFHRWNFKNKDLICGNCNLSYSKIKKENNELDKINQYKTIHLKKLANTYCLTGELHDLNSENICNLCKVNIDKKEYTNNELLQLDKNLKIINNKTFKNNIEKIKKLNKYVENIKIKESKVIKNYQIKYKKLTENRIENYINDFIDKLYKNLGESVKINDKNVYLNETVYYISNDYAGNIIDKTITILSKENKIKFIKNHEFYGRDVMYYHNLINNTYVFYDNITKNYLGYSKDLVNFKKYTSNASIKIKYSIKDMIKTLGLKNKYINFYHIDNKFMKMDNYSDINVKPILKKLILRRSNNLKNIIFKTQSIIEKIKNRQTLISNSKENNIVNQFNKILKNFKTDKDNRKKIFKHIFLLTNNIKMEKLDSNIKLDISKNYFDSSILNKINNVDSKLLFYYIYNLNRLVDYNENKNIKTNISYLIVNIISYLFYEYYLSLEETEFRKFDFLLLNDTPYLDESLRVEGYYQELVDSKDINKEENEEKMYNMNEEATALDIDEYDEDDLYQDFEANEDIVENLMD